jgi:hypothetical protein
MRAASEARLNQFAGTCSRQIKMIPSLQPRQAQHQLLARRMAGGLHEPTKPLGHEPSLGSVVGRICPNYTLRIFLTPRQQPPQCAPQGNCSLRGSCGAQQDARFNGTAHLSGLYKSAAWRRGTPFAGASTLILRPRISASATRRLAPLAYAAPTGCAPRRNYKSLRVLPARSFGGATNPIQGNLIAARSN